MMGKNSQASPQNSSKLLGYRSLETESGMDRRTVRKILVGVPPDGEERGSPVWRLSTFNAAAEAYIAATQSGNSTAPLKEQKTAEEVRKLRLANDLKEGKLIERQLVLSRAQVMASELNKLRTECESRYPVKLAGRDIAGCREAVRAMFDDIGRTMADFAKLWEEPTK